MLISLFDIKIKTINWREFTIVIKAVLSLDKVIRKLYSGSIWSEM